MIFWRPKGMPINVKELRDGQHVEGYYKHQFDSFWKKMKHGTVRIKPYREYDNPDGWYIIEILIPGQMGPTRVGICYGKDERLDDSSTKFRLYDGLIYTRPRRRRILP